MLFYSWVGGPFILLLFSCFLSCQGNECIDKPDGHYVDQTTCYGYISCENYTTYYTQCLPGLVWNNLELYCTYGVCVQEKKGLRSGKLKKSVPGDCSQVTIVMESYCRSKIQCVALCVQAAKCKTIRWKEELFRCILYDSKCTINLNTLQTANNDIYFNI